MRRAALSFFDPRSRAACLSNANPGSATYRHMPADAGKRCRIRDVSHSARVPATDPHNEKQRTYSPMRTARAALWCDLASKQAACPGQRRTTAARRQRDGFSSAGRPLATEIDGSMRSRLSGIDTVQRACARTGMPEKRFWIDGMSTDRFTREAHAPEQHGKDGKSAEEMPVARQNSDALGFPQRGSNPTDRPGALAIR